MTNREQQIANRLAKATPGPWCIESCGEKGDGSNVIGVAFRSDDHECANQLSGWLEPSDDNGEEIEYYRDVEVAACEHRNSNSWYDATLIANAPADLAYYRDVVAGLRARIERLEKWLFRIKAASSEEQIATLVYEALEDKPS